MPCRGFLVTLPACKLIHNQLANTISQLANIQVKLLTYQVKPKPQSLNPELIISQNKINDFLEQTANFNFNKCILCLLS